MLRIGRATIACGYLLLPWLLTPLAMAQNRAADPPPGGEQVRVRLQAPLTTRFNRKGDMVSARVVEPATYAGGILEGDIRGVKSGGPGKPSAIQFEFRTLHMGDRAMPVTASIVAVENSKHESGRDEDGSTLGAIARSRGPVELTVKTGAVSFAPGSEFVLQLQLRTAR